MSFYPPKLYQPGATQPFKLSRSKIDMFLECPRCFYLARRLGVARPPIPAFTLNSAVDHLLKKEFDLLRKAKETHELMRKYHIDAVPYDHPQIDVWRENFTGIQYLHPETNLPIFGAVDDIWVDPRGSLAILSHTGSTAWIEPTLAKIKDALEAAAIPPPAAECEYCAYSKSRLLAVSQAAKAPA